MTARRTTVAEAGFTLIELMVAMAVLVVTLAATAAIVTAVSHDSAASLARGRATETSQVALDGITEYLENAVTPAEALQAVDEQVGGVGWPAGTSGFCWNDANPGPSPQSPLLGADPSGTTSAPSPPYPVGTTLVDPDTLSIIYAHDYALELCAYPQGGFPPRVYELVMPFSTCTSVGPGSVGDCSLEVVVYGTPGNLTYSPATDYNQPANGTVVGVVRNIWCDQGCQAALPCTPADQPVSDPCPNPATNGSCWSYLNPAGSTAVPSVCSGISSANEAAYTPPLFTYLGGQSATSAANVGGTNLDLQCASGTTGTCSPTVTSAHGSAPVCQPTVPLPSGVTSSDDAVCLTSTPIDAVEVRMTVLGTTQSVLTHLSPSTPRVTVTQTVDLPNLATGGLP
jgi:prepilin-type N-terminal cleavage/methylation domain-containing protein